MTRQVKDISAGVSGPNLKLLRAQSHSAHSAGRSSAYHSKTVDPTQIRMSETKQTKSEGRAQSLQDVDELVRND